MTHATTRGAIVLAAALNLAGATDARAQPVPARPAIAPPARSAPAPPRRQFDAITVPSGQEMIRALVAAQATPLAQLRRCAGKGAGDTDSDVGDFLSGYASLLIEQGRNWIVTVARPAPQPVNGVRVWRALVSFHRSNGDEDWAWGMEFLLRADDHRLVPGSIACIGMG